MMGCCGSYIPKNSAVRKNQNHVGTRATSTDVFNGRITKVSGVFKKSPNDLNRTPSKRTII